MRVIAGEFKGRSIATLKGDHTRPTASTTKEALFQMLGPFFPGGTVIDLYSGSGSLAIEAISRGMNCAYLVEKNKQACDIISKNIELLHLNDQMTLFKTSVRNGLRELNKQKLVADLIVMDPPYSVDILPDLKQIDSLNVLRPLGVLVAETDSNKELPDKIGDLEKIQVKDYGLSRLHFFRLNRGMEEKNND